MNSIVNKRAQSSQANFKKRGIFYKSDSFQNFKAPVGAMGAGSGAGATVFETPNFDPMAFVTVLVRSAKGPRFARPSPRRRPVPAFSRASPTTPDREEERDINARANSPSSL